MQIVLCETLKTQGEAAEGTEDVFVLVGTGLLGGESCELQHKQVGGSAGYVSATKRTARYSADACFAECMSTSQH